LVGLNPSRETLIRLLAGCLAALPCPDETQARDAIIELIGRKGRWINAIAKNFGKEFQSITRPTFHDIADWLQTNATFPDIVVRGAISNRATFGARAQQLQSLDLPAIYSVGELSQFLELDSADELEWLVAPNRFRGLRLTHYQTRLVKKRSGYFRLVEAPRSRLKFVQRRILHEILDRVPVSEACFGFVKQRDVRQFAKAHCNQGVVIRMDLEDFFPSIPTGRVHALWRTLGYTAQIATYLTWLCTSPPSNLDDELLARLPRVPRQHIEHQCNRDRLPQGAPTSGALANLMAYRMDQRFVGLVRKSGGCYSRYADDLAFSWPQLSDHHCQQLTQWIATTILECGFQVNFRKTRIMRRDQRQSLAGIVVNDRPGVERQTLERLRATLFNCVRFGPESQNRNRVANFQEHLRGQIAWIRHVNPASGKRLQNIYDKIAW
jgi:RNA-directed DNA polymerase